VILQLRYPSPLVGLHTTPPTDYSSYPDPDPIAYLQTHHQLRTSERPVLRTGRKFPDLSSREFTGGFSDLSSGDFNRTFPDLYSRDFSRRFFQSQYPLLFLIYIRSPDFNLPFNLIISISRSFFNPISLPSLEKDFPYFTKTLSNLIFP